MKNYTAVKNELRTATDINMSKSQKHKVASKKQAAEARTQYNSFQIKCKSMQQKSYYGICMYVFWEARCGRVYLL